MQDLDEIPEFVLDKLIDRIKNLEQEIDISLREHKDDLFP